MAFRAASAVLIIIIILFIMYTRTLSDPCVCREICVYFRSSREIVDAGVFVEVIWFQLAFFPFYRDCLLEFPRRAVSCLTSAIGCLARTSANG